MNAFLKCMDRLDTAVLAAHLWLLEKLSLWVGLRQKRVEQIVYTLMVLSLLALQCMPPYGSLPEQMMSLSITAMVAYFSLPLLKRSDAERLAALSHPLHIALRAGVDMSQIVVAATIGGLTVAHQIVPTSPQLLAVTVYMLFFILLFNMTALPSYTSGRKSKLKLSLEKLVAMFGSGWLPQSQGA